MMKHYLTILLVVCISINSFSQTQLPALFSDNMVLQQQQSVSVWGTDHPRTNITVTGSWGKNAKATTDDKGYWKLKLQTPAAGGPYNVVIKGSKEVTLNNVLIGEVWLCSGQSNMAMTVSGTTAYYQTDVNNSTNNFIRNFGQIEQIQTHGEEWAQGRKSADHVNAEAIPTDDNQEAICQ